MIDAQMILADVGCDRGTWRERLCRNARSAATGPPEPAAGFAALLLADPSVEFDMVLALDRAPSTVELKFMAEQRMLQSMVDAADVSAPKQEQQDPAAPASSIDRMSRRFVRGQQMLRSYASPSRAHGAPSEHTWAGKKLSGELASASANMAPKAWMIRSPQKARIDLGFPKM